MTFVKISQNIKISNFFLTIKAKLTTLRGSLKSKNLSALINQNLNGSIIDNPMFISRVLFPI